jgi:hypothetical protein
MDVQIKQQVKETLETYGVEVRIPPGRPHAELAGEAEIWVLGTGPEAPRVLALELRTRTRAGESRGAAATLPRLWVAEHIPPATADRLIAAGEAFVDGTGNAHLRLPGIVLHVEGRRAPRRKREERIDEDAPREWRGPALRLLFRILCEPALAEEPYTAIADAALTAQGTVTHVFTDLERSGNLVRLGGRKRRFVPDALLVERWIAEYGRKLYPRNLLGRYEATAEKWWHRFDPLEHEACWGGEPAAALLGVQLRPEIRTLYTARPPTDLIRAARLRPNADGHVEVRGVFWNGAPPAPRRDLVHPLLIVADLMATRDGRCREAARLIQEEHLARLLR